MCGNRWLVHVNQDVLQLFGFKSNNSKLNIFWIKPFIYIDIEIYAETPRFLWIKYEAIMTALHAIWQNQQFGLNRAVYSVTCLHSSKSHHLPKLSKKNFLSFISDLLCKVEVFASLCKTINKLFKALMHYPFFKYV